MPIDTISLVLIAAVYGLTIILLIVREERRIESTSITEALDIDNLNKPDPDDEETDERPAPGLDQLIDD